MPANGFPVDQSPGGGLQQRLPGARSALILLLAINLFNYIDRQVLAAVEPQIRAELLPGVNDAEAKFWMGSLSFAFLITFMTSAPLFGWLAERISRWTIVAIGVIVWSIASGASGANWGADLGLAFWLLLCTRLFVGVGEGAYGPVAPTMLSDLYPVKDRGWVMAWFYLAIPVGGALGYALGEVVSNIWTWRHPFYVVVAPGILLGCLCFFMREPPRGRADAVEVAPGRKLSRADYLDLWRIPSYTLCTFGMTAMTFSMGALAFWMSDYLKQVEAPSFAGMGPVTTFGVFTALSGLIATITGGWAGDWLRGKVPGSYFIVSGCAMVIGFPMVLLFLWAPFPLAWLFLFLAVFCLFFNNAPTNAILANVTHPAVRASGFAMNIFVIHALGDAISPPVIGYISGRTSTAFGFVVVSIFMVVGGILWLFGARFLERDTVLAPTRLRPAADA